MDTYLEVAIDKTKRSEIVLSYYLAPVILKEKPAGLFAFHQETSRYAIEIARALGVHCFKLTSKEEKDYLFFYQEDLLWETVRIEGNQSYLEQFGYHIGEGGNTEELLAVLKEHFQSCLLEQKPFPHEIGILLGYPLDDVKAFILKNGQEALLTGYWKVYHNLETARKTFAKYDQARKKLLLFVTEHPLSDWAQ